eukprot:2421091-Alexandrium_andersonii.AAC.1
MSASLVGSEMCIRDRASRASPDRPPGHGMGSKHRSSAPETAGRCSSKGCLLYTSDAADDM